MSIQSEMVARCDAMIADGEQWLRDVAHARGRFPDIQTASDIERMKAALETARSLKAKLLAGGAQ